VVGVLSVLIGLTPGASDVLYTVVVVAVSVALPVSVKRHGLANRSWFFFCVGIGLFALDNVVVTGVSRAWLPSDALIVDAVLVVLATVVTLAGTAEILRSRRGPLDMDTALDAAVAATATAAVTCQLAFAPGAQGADDVANNFVVVALMAATVALAVQLAFVAPELAAARMLVASSTLGLVGNAAFGFLPRPLGIQCSSAAWSACVLLLLMATTHPSAKELTGQREGRPPGLVIGRLVVLGAALLAPPFMSLLNVGDQRLSMIGFAAAMGTTGLALWRLGRLLRERERQAQAQAALTELGRQALVSPFDAFARSAVTSLRDILSATAVVVLRADESGTAIHSSGLAPSQSKDLDMVRPPVRDGATRAADVGTLEVGTEAMAYWRYGTLEPPDYCLLLVSPIPAGLGPMSAAGAAILAAAIERSRAEKELRHQAQYDALTGLLNRRSVQAEMEQALRTARAMAVLFLDLDGFKQVNDTLGHDAGDAVLRAVATRLQGAVRPSDVVARLGGDEFVIVIYDDDIHGCNALSRRLLAAIQQPIQVDTGVATVSASIGVSLLATATTGVTADMVLRTADQAMYRTKQAGKHGMTLVHIS